MIRINSKDIPYQKAFYSLAYNDALEPTGLGSIGVLARTDKQVLYIGIKNDVISIITDKGVSDFINLDEDIIKLSETLSDNAKFGDGKVEKIYINEDLVEIDVALLRNKIYTQIDEYASILPKTVFKEDTTLGAILYLKVPISTNGLIHSFGYIYTQDTELLVINDKITSKDILSDLYRYSIWVVKANIVPHTLSRSSKTQAFEKIRCYHNDTYGVYFNNIVDGLKDNIEQMRFELEKLPYSKTVKPLYSIVEKRDSDVFRANSSLIGPGIVNGYDMTNFGVKEAREGYFELSKGKAYINVGYEGSNIRFGDNFYVAPKGKGIENISAYSLPKELSLHMEDKLTYLLKDFNMFDRDVSANKFGDKYNFYQHFDRFKLALNSFIESKISELLSKKTSQLELAKSLDEAVLEFVYESVSNRPINKKYLSSLVNVYTDYKIISEASKIKPKINTTVIFIHPFYDVAYFVSLDEATMPFMKETYFISPRTHSKFGFDKDGFYFKGIKKEFRDSEFVDLEMFRVNMDLMYKENLNVNLGLEANSKLELYNKISDKISNDFCYMFVLDNEYLVYELAKRGVQTNKDYPFGLKYGYIRKWYVRKRIC